MRRLWNSRRSPVPIVLSTIFIHATLFVSSTLAQGSPKQTKEQIEKADALVRIGLQYYSEHSYARALDSLNQALTIAQATGNPGLLAVITIDRGIVYEGTGDLQKAADLFKEALALGEQFNNKPVLASALLNLGNVYLRLSQYENGVQYLQRTLPMKREINDRAGEAKALITIGGAYFELGQYESALQSFQGTLPLTREIHALELEGSALGGIGIAYFHLGDKQKALSFLTEGLSVFQKIGRKDLEAAALTSLGFVIGEIGDREKALAYFSQALPLAREVSTQGIEVALILAYTGYTYAEMGNRQKAIEYYNQALPRLTSLGTPLYQAHVTYALFQVYKDDQPGLAIYYGKQAVHYLQLVRENIKGMGEDVRANFLASHGFEEHPIADYYHSLADVLIGQGRLSEARQILDLLKEQEYADYAHGGRPSPANSQPIQPPALTATESQAEQDYRNSTQQLVTLGEQLENLKKLPARTTEQERQFRQISEQLSQASQQMNDGYYARLYTRFGKNSSANKEVAEVKGNAALLRQQLAQMPQTVALYTLVTKDRYSVIVITGSTMVARESLVKEEELNQKIDALGRQLRNPAQDPKALAAELYKTLVGPVEADLAQARATTLVWVLDGKLRYLPMSALYDGKQYLIERYNSVSILPVSIPHLSEKPDIKRISVSAMGISRQYDNELVPLPSVKYELDEIVRDPHEKDSRGVLPGTILLDGNFTEKTMADELGTPHPIVHIASHFVFRAGDDRQSYLLLAGKEEEGPAGYHLTVADFRDNQRLALDDTELLTLSACDTGVSGNAGDGREVDGLATTAQLKGAKAVIASLWEVNDNSTGDLMADFYHRWAGGNGSVTKVEALRQAQIDLLTGRIKLKANPSANFSHPYYWAPFVLTGNWQ